MVVAKGVLERVFEEARAAYARDEESCGFLVGPASEPLAVTEAVPMENRANKLHALDPETYPRTGRMYFDIDPLKFSRAIEQGEACGQPVKVLYHSHLDVGAYFSDTDAAATKMGGDEPAYDLAYLVTSVRAGGVDDHKLFVWDPDASSFVEGRWCSASEAVRADARACSRRRWRARSRSRRAGARAPTARRLRQAADRVVDEWHKAGAIVDRGPARFLYDSDDDDDAPAVGERRRRRARRSRSSARAG